jgi:hypothetical protein
MERRLLWKSFSVEMVVVVGLLGEVMELVTRSEI